MPENVMNRPKVTVAVITYNHACFVREALASIFRQQVNFSYELIIGDDLSTDDTRDIIRTAVSNAPCEVTLLFPDHKVGGAGNFAAVHRSARGEYIAILDGDDAMLPGRLQRQVDFLDDHPGCSFVGHRVVAADRDFDKPLYFQPAALMPEILSIDGLVQRGCFFVNSSKMYRREQNAAMAGEIHQNIDFYHHVVHTSTGQMGFLNDVLGVYRTNVNSSLSKLQGDKLQGQFESTLKAYDRASELGADPVICRRFRDRYRIKASLHFFRIGNGPAAIHNLNRIKDTLEDNIAWRGLLALLRFGPTRGMMFWLLSHVVYGGRQKPDPALDNTQPHLDWVRDVNSLGS